MILLIYKYGDNMEKKKDNEKSVNKLAIIAFALILLGPLLIFSLNYLHFNTVITNILEYVALILPFAGIVLLIDIRKEHKDNKLAKDLSNGIKIAITIILLIVMFAVIRCITMCSKLS